MKLSKLLPAILTLSLLQGCAAVVIAGAATGAVSSVEDRRSLGAQIDDNAIELKASSALNSAQGVSDNAHIVIKSVNGNLLVVGQAPNEYLRDLAIKALGKVAGVKKVHNQVRIGNAISMTTQTVDSWITSKVKLMLLTEKGLNSNNIQVLTENSEVYLMGLVTEDEANKAVEVARNISGVAKVIKVFEIL
jgi:osmotically-inducible protein OsmY